MKALTLHQPWASLVALGVKTIETRSWSTSYRGPLAIHAGTKRFGFSSETAELVRSMPLQDYRRLSRAVCGDPELSHNFPLGAVVATCTLVDVVPMVPGDMRFDSGGGLIPEPDLPHLAVTRQELTLWQEEPFVWGSPNEFGEVDLADQRPYGDFTPGRWAWLLGDVRPLKHPVPMRGRQGLWTPPYGCLEAVS